MFLSSLWKTATRSRTAVPAHFRRKASRKRPQARRLRCEPLEERQLLSAITTFSNNTPVALKDTGGINSKTTSTMSVPAGYLVSGVTLNITHPRNNDLQAAVIGPDGTRASLFAAWQVSGQNFVGTKFDDRYGTSFDHSAAPYTGTFVPISPLDLFRGKKTQGTWKLEIIDSVKGQAGRLNSWSLTAVQASAISTSFLDNNPTILGHANSSWKNGVAMADNGDAMAVWIESKGRRGDGPLVTMAARFDAAAGTWGTAAILSNTTDSAWGLNDSAIAGDGRGNYLAVWNQVTRNSTTSTTTLWANRYVAGSGWQGPQLLDTVAGSVGVLSPRVAMAYDPTAGVTTAVVAYGSQPTGSSLDDIKLDRLTNFSANTWSGTALAESLDVDLSSSLIGVAMAANGDFLITFAGSAAPHDPYYRQYQWSTGWTGPEGLVESRSEDAAAPKLAMNSAGEAIVTWSQATGTAGARQVWARRWDGTGWTADPELVSDDPGNGASPWAVAISENGEAAVLYGQKRGATAYRDAYVRRLDGQAWLDIVKVDSEDLGDAGGYIPPISLGLSPQLVMDPAGNAFAAWPQPDGEFTNVWSAKFDHSTSTWSPATRLENAPFNAHIAAAAVNRSGVVTAIWEQCDATLHHIYAGRTMLAPADAQPLAAVQSPLTLAPLPVQGSLAVTSSSDGNSLAESTAEAPATRSAFDGSPLPRLADKPSRSAPTGLQVSLVDEALGQVDLLDDLLGIPSGL